MFSLLYSKTPHSLSSILRNFCDFRTLECPPVIIITRSLSSTISSKKQVKHTSFTVSYLINSCGLSPEEANVVSKKVQFATPDRADSVLALFNKHGFNDSQIARIVKIWPNVLLADPKKTIADKLEFFYSIGITGTNLAKFVSSYPTVLWRSLSNRIVPLYNLLKRTLLVDDHILIKAIINASRYFLPEEARISANIALLREVRMSESVLVLLVTNHFDLLCLKGDNFRNKINEVIDMGFPPVQTKFVRALVAVSSLSKSTWQHKIEVFVRCGWSKDEIMSAFQKDPQCICLSEKKIINTMDFLVNVMDMKPSVIATIPHIFTYSLGKRIIPRGLVVKILMLKCLFAKDTSFYNAVHKTEKCFLEWYVVKHKEHVPYLMDLYEGRMCPRELHFASRYVQKQVET